MSCDDRDSGLAALAASLGPRLGPAATFATTEHFNLQTARAITVSEANGRASIYLAALSSEPPRIFRRENQLRSFLFWKERGNGDGEAAQVIHA